MKKRKSWAIGGKKPKATQEDIPKKRKCTEIHLTLAALNHYSFLFQTPSYFWIFSLWIWKLCLDLPAVQKIPHLSLEPVAKPCLSQDQIPLVMSIVWPTALCCSFDRYQDPLYGSCFARKWKQKYTTQDSSLAVKSERKSHFGELSILYI